MFFIYAALPETFYPQKGNNMKKRILAALLAVFMMLSMLVGCSNKETVGANETDAVPSGEAQQTNEPATSGEKETTASPDITTKVETEMIDPIELAPPADGPIDLSRTGATRNMIKRSVVNEGDLARLASKISYAMDHREESTTIVFLGDSILAGSSASSSNQFANLVSGWWEYTVSPSFRSVNASIGATDSHLAVHRLERDVFPHDPDVIFIEYINDKNDEFYKASMDSLVRRCLSYESNPAVILVEMALKDGSGGPQQVHSEVGRYYGVPVISYHNAIMPEINAGNFKWTDISADSVHPNDMGHSIAAQLVTTFLDGVVNKLDKIDKTVSTDIPVSPLGYKYENAHIVNRDSAELVCTNEGSFTGVPAFGKNFTSGWGTTTGGKMTFEIEMQNLGVVYNKSTAGGYGVAKITVDGVEVKRITDADFTGGWGSYARTVEVFSSDKVEKHTVTIEIEGTEKPKFDIYSFLVS